MQHPFLVPVVAFSFYVRGQSMHAGTSYCGRAIQAPKRVPYPVHIRKEAAMTTSNFPDAIAELVRHFSSVDQDNTQLAMQRSRRLNVVAETTQPAQDRVYEEIDWFDNFPV